MNFLPSANGRLVVIAFEGWNDAGEAAVDSARHLIAQWGLRPTATLVGDEFYDMTFIRPTIRRTESGPEIDWPRCTKHSGTVTGTAIRVEVLIGMEPSYRWQDYMAMLMEHIGDEDHVVLLGALLADVAHTRPLPVSTTADSAELAERFDVEPAEYEGPTGIIGALATALFDRGVAVVSQWVAVPVYAASSPSPKAVLALLGAFEDLTGLVVPQHELVEDARAWELGTDALVESDEDLAEHVERIEGMTDAAELPEASGDAIAREFERYLNRRRWES
ncbi:filament polymerization regulator ParJ [Brevibacterium daeguense]|uniref:Filament polymerization regulator ParJ n=1 Tax=Brevibacterium daeguense TaxID=909936 RepID=A0ABP8EP00_9MICO|nr:PAC2 family protein [Brevibacterium daeguense]